jgi:hypothetical protein
VKGCHSCEYAAAIAEGEYAGRAWKDIPCSGCDVMSGSGFAIEFDESRKEIGVDGENLKAEMGKLKWGEEPEKHEEDNLPVGVMQEIVVGLLKLKPELRDVVAWRFAGIRYDDIALAQGVTRGCAEKRHRRALELWPALRSLFPRKVAKQGMRKSRSKADHAATCASRGVNIGKS